MRETGALELASTITLVLQANRLTEVNVRFVEARLATGNGLSILQKLLVY